MNSATSLDTNGLSDTLGSNYAFFMDGYKASRYNLY